MTIHIISDVRPRVCLALAQPCLAWTRTVHCSARSEKLLPPPLHQSFFPPPAEGGGGRGETGEDSLPNPYRIHAESIPNPELEKKDKKHIHTSESAAESLLPPPLPPPFPLRAGRATRFPPGTKQKKAAPRPPRSSSGLHLRSPLQNPTRNKLHHHACARALESLVPPPSTRGKNGRQKSVPNCTGSSFPVVPSSSQGQFQPAHTAPDEVISARTAPGRLLAVFSKQQKIK